MTSADRAASGLLLSGVTIRLAGKHLLSIDAAIAPGETLTVMGPSGIGKSSLLAFVAGFLATEFQAEGRVVLNGRDVTRLSPERRGMGLLFQDPLLFPHLSVGGNLLVGLHADMRGRQARRHAAEMALAEGGLDGFFDRDPATLSGGQAARVALLRALLASPEALLLDEPFSRLDAALRTQTREQVFADTRKRNLPVLLVTHDPADADSAGGRVVTLG